MIPCTREACRRLAPPLPAQALSMVLLNPARAQCPHAPRARRVCMIFPARPIIINKERGTGKDNAPYPPEIVVPRAELGKNCRPYYVMDPRRETWPRTVAAAENAPQRM